MNDTGSVRNVNIQDILVSTVNKSKWTLILSIVYIGSSKELHTVELNCLLVKQTISLSLRENYLQTLNSLVCTVIIPVDMMSTISSQ